MIKIENVQTEIYVIIIIFSLIFFLFSNIQINHLIIIIILILISYIVFFYLQNESNEKDIGTQYQKNTFDNDIKDRKEISEKIFYIDKYPKQCKYLKENAKLMDIVINIRFIKRFSKHRYSDIILNMNKLMKIYIYILSERYDIVSYISIFLDIRDNILEMMYSLIMIVPEKLSHTYGFDPQEELNKSITDFTIYCEEMINILEKFGKIHKNVQYIPDTKLRAYNIAREGFYP